MSPWKRQDAGRKASDSNGESAETELFDLKARQPSGKWNIHEAYAFLWEAYRREYKPQLIAVARPHRLAQVGETVVLDGARSWSSAGKISRYAWTFTDGTTATGRQVKRRYDKPGAYRRC